MISFDDIAKENIFVHNPAWSQILDYPYKIFINVGPGSDQQEQILY